MDETQLSLLRLAIQLAADAREKGNHPFGSVLADANGRLLLKAENTVVTMRDCAGHAETNLVRLACAQFERDFLATCTLYTSTEPCAMCAGAIYWSNIGRVVYGLSEAALRTLTGADPSNPTLALPCRSVFARGSRSIEVLGPLLEQEALRVHQGFWNPSR